MSSTYITNNEGVNLIKSFEKLRLESYLPTPNDKLTIGYGHTGKDVKQGMKINEKQALELLRKDLKSAENTKNKKLIHFAISFCHLLLSFCHSVVVIK